MRPVTGGSGVLVHFCAACKGVWLDREVLAAICPTVAHLPDHRDEALLLGGKSLGSCPRCGVTPVVVDVAGVEVDFCGRCNGVWLDGDEVDEPDGEAPLSGDDGGRSPYRSAPEPVRTSDVACAHCGRATPIGRTYMREHGLVCPGCHAAAEERLRRVREGR